MRRARCLEKLCWLSRRPFTPHPCPHPRAPPAPLPQELLRRVSTWLKPGGKLFVHIFVHRGLPYHYEVSVVCVCE
jgi:hypothetical protein